MRKWLRCGLWMAAVVGGLVIVLFPVLLMMTQRSFDQTVTNLHKARTELAAKAASAGKQSTTTQVSPGRNQPREPAPATDNLPAISALSEHYHALQGACWWEIRDAPPSQWDAARWKEAREFLKQYAPLLEEIRRFAKSAGRGTMDGIDRSRLKEISSSTDTIRFARLLAISAGLAASDGNADLAMDDISAAFALALATPPLGMAQRMCWDEACDGLGCALRTGGLAQAQIDSLVQVAGEALPNRDAFATGLLNEFEGASLMANDPSTLLTTENPNWPARLAIEVASLPITKPLRLNEASFAGEDIGQILPLVDSPYYEVAGQLREIEGESRHAFSVFARLTGSLAGNYFMNQVRSETSYGMLQLASALGKYRNENGSYPPSLDAIASSFGGQVPLDPFTGQPYRYRVSGDGFVLYSLGPNQVDDAGSRDDMVWTSQKKDAAAPKARMERAKA